MEETTTRFILKLFTIATFYKDHIQSYWMCSIITYYTNIIKSIYMKTFFSASLHILITWAIFGNKSIDIRELHRSSTTQPASTLLFQPLLPESQDAFRGPPPSFHLLCCSFVPEISSFIFITKFQSPSPHPHTLHSPSFFSFMVPKGRIPVFPSHHPPSRNPSNWPYECPQMTHRLRRNKGWQMCSQN